MDNRPDYLWTGNANIAATGLIFLPEVGDLTSLRKEEVRIAAGVASPQVTNTQFIVKLKAKYCSQKIKFLGPPNNPT